MSFSRKTQKTRTLIPKNNVTEPQDIRLAYSNNQLKRSYQRFKNGIFCFSYFYAQHLIVAQRIKKQSVDYTSAKVKLI